MRRVQCTVFALALVALASVAFAADPKHWDGKPLPFITEDIDTFFHQKLHMASKGTAAAAAAMSAGRPEEAYDWKWQPETAASTAASTEVVDAMAGVSREAGWHREVFHANQDMVKGTDAQRETAYFGVGYADGYVLAQRLWNQYKMSFESDYTDYIVNIAKASADTKWMMEFMSEQRNWTENFAREGKSHFALNMRNQLALYRGRSAGYNQRLADGKAGKQPALTNGALELDYNHIYFLLSGLDRFNVMTFNGFGRKHNGTEWYKNSLWYPNAGPFGNVENQNSDPAHYGPNDRLPTYTGPNRTKPQMHHHRCVCGAKLTDDDLLLGRGTLYQFADMNNSITTVTLESQVTMIRQQFYMASIEDFYMTSNKMLLCSVTEVAYDPRLMNGTSPHTVLTPLTSLYAALFTTEASKLAETIRNHNGVIPNAWMAIDFKKFVPAANGKKASLLPGAVYGVDVYAGNVTLSEDLTSNVSTGELIVAAAKPITRQAETMFGDRCKWCWLVDRAQDPSGRELPGLVKNTSELEPFFRKFRYNNYKNDSMSMFPAPLPAVRCGALAVASRYDLGGLSQMADTNWATQTCTTMDWGTIDTTVTSYKLWLGDKPAHASVDSYPIMSILGPTYENKDTPPFVPAERAETQASHYYFPPVNFTLAINAKHVLPPASGTSKGTAAEGATSSRVAAVFVVLAVGTIASVGVIVAVVMKRRQQQRNGESAMYEGELTHFAQ